MDRFKHISTSRDKTLFTPGPLTTSRTVKQAMLRDLGSRDVEFKEMVQEIRCELLRIAGLKKSEYEVVLMQGSGTFGLESVVSSSVPPGGKLLVIVNGAYGKRIVDMSKIMNIDTLVLERPENSQPSLNQIEDILFRDKAITNVAVVHCETTLGIMNQIKEIGEIVKATGKIFFVDAVTTFGAVPINFQECGIDYLVAAVNKSLEGVPGFSVIFAKSEHLQQIKNCRRSLSLDLYAQWEELETSGEFRFTPPTHAMMAFKQALIELEEEGGVKGRAERYKANTEVLIPGMRKLGFREYLFPNVRSYIITAYLNHDHPNYSFEEFYKLLSEKDQIIYPWKLNAWSGFRIGTMGRIFPKDIKRLLNAIEETLNEMGVEFYNQANVQFHL